MYVSELFNLFLKYAIFGAVIFLVIYKVPGKAIDQKDNLVITAVSVAIFILIDLFGGYLVKLKNLLCGCSSNSYSSAAVSTPSTCSSSVDDSPVI
jgi:hypothetical protein